MRTSSPDGTHSLSQAGPIAQTVYGPVTGVRAEGVTIWRGIRYAAAPTGSQRFRAPLAPEPWTSPADASSFGAVAPQLANPAINLGEETVFDEDCLFLNVYAPDKAASSALTEPKTGEGLPVLFWIHGGAYSVGASSQPLYDGSALARTGDVIVVTVNYRIGAFGFIDLSSFSDEREQFDSNLGLRDILFALEWVRENIREFGGDPEQVTIFGESAGGGIVTTLLTIPAAAGLFRAAIAQSSPATSVYGPERARHCAQLFLDAAGVSADTVARVRDLPTDVLRDAAGVVARRVPVENPGVLGLAPVVDGELVPHYPVGAFRKGLAHRVPLMIGTNRDEAAAFRFMKSPLMPITPEAIQSMFDEVAHEHPDLVLPDQAQIASAYAGYPHIGAGLGIARDAAFRMPTVWIAEGHSAFAPVWLYRFDFTTPMLKLLRLGASHGTELPYVWGHLHRGPKDITFALGGRRTGERLSARMQARWTSFARTGQPRDENDELEWPPYTTGSRATLVFDSHDRVVNDLDEPLRTTWGDKVIALL